jgi:hypothetical protein
MSEAAQVQEIQPLESFDGGSDGFTVEDTSSSQTDMSWDDIPVGESDDSSNEANAKDSTDKDSPENPDFLGEATELAPNEDSGEEEEGSDPASPEADSSKEQDQLDLNSIKDSKVMVKVDGQDQEVSVQDLINNYSGKVAYDKRFSELTTARKEFEQEMGEVDNYLNEFAQDFEKGDVLGAVSKFAGFANVPAFEMKHRMLTAFKDEYVRIMEMGPDKYNQEYIENEREYFKQQLQSVQEKGKQEQAQRELQQTQSKYQEQYGINAEEWSSAETFLKERIAEDASLAARLPLTPENIAGYVQRYKADVRVSNIAGSVDASLSQNGKLVETLTEIALENPDLSDDEFKEMISQQYEIFKGNSTKERLVQKVEKKSGITHKKQQKPKLDLMPLESWDDI